MRLDLRYAGCRAPYILDDLSKRHTVVRDAFSRSGQPLERGSGETDLPAQRLERLNEVGSRGCWGAIIGHGFCLATKSATKR